MDEAIRSLERAWRSGDASALDALVREYRRAGRELPAELIRALPRWRMLVGFVERWCERPLGEADTVHESFLRAKEAELGFRLPTTLYEWYRIVGASLRPVYHIPTPLADLNRLRNWHLEGLSRPQWYLKIFEECHGRYAWVVAEEDMAEEDPRVWGILDDEPFRVVAGHLSEFLTAETLSEATCGIEQRDCTLGVLRKEARAGILQRDPEWLPPFPALELPPLLGGEWELTSRLYGDDDTILKVEAGTEGTWFSAVTRTLSAWTRLTSLPGIHVVE